MGPVLIAGGALLGSVLGTIWGGAHRDPTFGRGFNAFIGGTYGMLIGVAAGALLWLIATKVVPAVLRSARRAVILKR
jgi:zinc transporter ZupT